MPWFRIDDKMYTHRKILGISSKRKIQVSERDAAVSLWVLAGLWATDNLMDGWIPDEHVETFVSGHLRAELLVRAALWHRIADLLADDSSIGCAECVQLLSSNQNVTDGYVFHDWENYQPTKASVVAERVAATERQRRRRAAGKGRSAPRVSQRDNGVTTGVTQPDVTPPVTDMSRRDNGVSHGDVTDMSHDPRSRTRTRRALEDDEPLRKQAPKIDNASSSSNIFTPDLRNPRCEKHAHIPVGVWNPDPCTHCGQVTAWAKEETAKRSLSPSVLQLSAAQRRRDIAACKQCDDEGWLLDSNREPVEPSVQHHPVVKTEQAR